jgi:hypothetical protein
MSHPIRTVVALCALAAGLAATSAPAAAATPAADAWRQSHPRRAEVNARLAHQQARIHHELREGELSPERAAQLSRQDHAIRRQERRMAADQGGHITAAQQARLNREENAVSREIPR